MKVLKLGRREKPRMLAIIFLLAACPLVVAEDQRTVSVGMNARVESIIIPGRELVAKPLDDERSPIVLRIADTFPHGTAFRYDLVYYGLEPGAYDLRDYLKRVDGSSMEDVPPIKVTIQAILPPGQVLPHELAANRSPWGISYQMMLVAGGVLWLVGLFFILFYRKNKTGGQHEEGVKPLTVAEKLRPMVEGAIAGKLSHGELADLERTIIEYWRQRLQMDDLKPAQAIHQLRQNAESGPLLLQLEKWLHQPDTANDVDPTELLRPYNDLPAEQMELV